MLAPGGCPFADRQDHGLELPKMDHSRNRGRHERPCSGQQPVAAEVAGPGRPVQAITSGTIISDVVSPEWWETSPVMRAGPLPGRYSITSVPAEMAIRSPMRRLV